MTYNWEVYGSDNLTEVYLEDARDYVVGETQYVTVNSLIRSIVVCRLS